ncbi:MAG: putative nucleotidyltransferase substrate binding domain-containing protein, partial [Thiotrichales bacterium]
DEADSVELLAAISRQLPNVLVNLVRGSLTAHDTANTISLIGESICRRLLQLGEAKLGPPPVPYAFVVCGSMARREQTAHSDQDNGMVISDEMKPEHDAYFLALAKYVSDGLNTCGYVYCNGDVMATNPKWRLTYSQWRRNFDTWIDTPQPMALMYSSIFFDMRGVHGDVQMVKDLAGHVLAKTRASTIFLAHMARNAMQFQPPLGIFRQFVLEKGKDHGEALDLKKRGIMPVIDLVRVYALSVGTRSLNTCRRLEECERLGAISKSGSEDLRDALEFISTLRLEHQARQIEAGQQPDNFLSPESLSALERRHLKDAFEVVRTLQASAEQRYQLNRF